VSDVQSIVAGLTKSQRAALIGAEPDGHLSLRFIRWWKANGRTLRALRRKGLGTAVWSGVALNADGLKVRDALTNSEGGGE